eukprot:CAMPEP_0202693650 /NCGR_PEP_ID=MMETSP1385-20130828/7695_1 /ASSEMBLY_ACC=CAM_ASM_000861 /TAXON_ID=933848 /ORGANISM="Elphidium margaritaceum" /LENGTH=315 /DNA_ID=CAMNT_0049349353 /DNA_START=32 /DNA_END=979 /DNA_ORIENTATION=+
MAEEQKLDAGKTTILVTGANKGIGFSLCELLVKHAQFHVIVACRNFAHVPKPTQKDAKRQADNYELIKGKNDDSLTRIQILRDVRFKGVPNVDFVELDICDKNSVAKAVEVMKAKYKSIDILVNNAGMAFKGNAFDINVVNTTLTTNYYGTMNVTQPFLPLIKDGGKILFVSSTAGTLSSNILDNATRATLLKADLQQGELEQILSNFKQCVEKDKSMKNTAFRASAYGMSKVAMSAYSRIVAAQVKNRNIFVAAYCPGYCNTYMSSGGGNRSSTEGAKGLELLCTEQKTMENTAKFWKVEFGADKTAKLVESSW